MKKEDPERRAELAPLDVIRVETALSRFPMHRLAKTGAVEIVIREQNATGDLLRWEVSYNSKFGQPGPLAYKLDTLVINRKIEAAGRPIPKVVKLGSLREIADATGTGDGNTTTIKRALYQNSSAYITAKVRYRATEGAERSIEIGDTRYAVVLTGETLPDGRTADAVYIVLHDFYREVLDNALARPLDYDYLKGLPPAAQRLYEVVSYAMFAALKNDRPRARLTYSEFCRLAPLTRHFDWEHTRKQMAKIHAPHREAGYLAGVEFEATSEREGRPDWTMLYTPGPKAKAEYQAFTRKGGPVALKAEPAQPEPELEPTSLERELIDRGVTRGVAAELVRDFPEELIQAKVEHIDWLQEERPKKIKDMGAYLAEAIREDYATPVGFEGRAERAERETTERERADQAGRAKARRREEQARLDAYRRRLGSEERERLDAEALERADPALRAELEGETRPFMKRLLMSAVRDAHLKSILNVPVVG